MRKTNLFILTLSLAAISCARNPTTPGPVDAVTPSGPEGLLSASALGDVKSGTGALEFFNVRMDRQNATTGASIFRQYANPGQTYNFVAGERIELWVEYSGAINPRVRVDWGNGEIDRFDGQKCGACLLRHTYPRPGTWTVVVTLDDEQGTTVTRSFVLNSIVDQPIATLNVGFANGPFCGDVVRLTAPGGINCVRASSTTTGTCSANYSPGTTVTITYSVSSPEPLLGGPKSISFCSGYSAWLGACSGVGTGAGNSASCTLTLPSGVTSTTVQLQNYD